MVKTVKSASKTKTSTTTKVKKTKTLSSKTVKSASKKTTKAKKTKAKETLPPTPPETTTKATVTLETTTTSDATETPIEKPTHLQITIERLQANYDEVLADMDETLKMQKAIITRMKRLRKQTVREVNALYKRQVLKKKPKKPRKPSGFAKPTEISEELCEFLKIPKGTKMARTAVTKLVTAYIAENNLQNQKTRRKSF